MPDAPTASRTSLILRITGEATVISIATIKLAFSGYDAICPGCLHVSSPGKTPAIAGDDQDGAHVEQP
jgi:hypothetical protein